MKIDRLRIGRRRPMKHPAPNRIQVVQFDALVPSVSARNVILHYPENLAIDRKQSDSFVPDGSQGKCGCGQFSHIERNQIGQALMKQIIEIGLRRPNYHPDVGIQGPGSEGSADIHPFVAGGEQHCPA